MDATAHKDGLAGLLAEVGSFGDWAEPVLANPPGKVGPTVRKMLLTAIRFAGNAKYYATQETAPAEGRDVPSMSSPHRHSGAMAAARDRHRSQLDRPGVPAWVRPEFDTFWSILMSAITDLIAAEQSARATLTAQVASLQSQLAAAQSAQLSDADMAAIKTEELALSAIQAPAAPPTNQSSGSPVTLAAGTGTDSVVAGTGTDSVAGGAAPVVAPAAQ